MSVMHKHFYVATALHAPSIAVHIIILCVHEIVASKLVRYVQPLDTSNPLRSHLHTPTYMYIRTSEWLCVCAGKTIKVALMIANDIKNIL